MANKASLKIVEVEHAGSRRNIVFYTGLTVAKTRALIQSSFADQGKAAIPATARILGLRSTADPSADVFPLWKVASMPEELPAKCTVVLASEPSRSILEAPYSAEREDSSSGGPRRVMSHAHNYHPYGKPSKDPNVRLTREASRGGQSAPAVEIKRVSAAPGAGYGVPVRRDVTRDEDVGPTPTFERKVDPRMPQNVVVEVEYEGLRRRLGLRSGSTPESIEKLIQALIPTLRGQSIFGFETDGRALTISAVARDPTLLLTLANPAPSQRPLIPVWHIVVERPDDEDEDGASAEDQEFMISAAEHKAVELLIMQEQPRVRRALELCPEIRDLLDAFIRLSTEYHPTRIGSGSQAPQRQQQPQLTEAQRAAILRQQQQEADEEYDSEDQDDEEEDEEEDGDDGRGQQESGDPVATALGQFDLTLRLMQEAGIITPAGRAYLRYKADTHDPLVLSALVSYEVHHDRNELVDVLVRILRRVQTGGPGQVPTKLLAISTQSEQQQQQQQQPERKQTRDAAVGYGATGTSSRRRPNTEYKDIPLRDMDPELEDSDVGGYARVGRRQAERKARRQLEEREEGEITGDDDGDDQEDEDEDEEKQYRGVGASASASTAPKESDDAFARRMYERYSSGYHLLPGTPQEVARIAFTPEENARLQAISQKMVTEMKRQEAAKKAASAGSRGRSRLDESAEDEDEEEDEDGDESEAAEALAGGARVHPSSMFPGQSRVHTIPEADGPGRDDEDEDKEEDAVADALETSGSVLPNGLFALGPRLAEKMASVFELEGTLNELQIKVFQVLAKQNDMVVTAAFNLYMEDENWDEFKDSVKRRVDYILDQIVNEEDEPEDAEAAGEDRVAQNDDGEASDEGDDRENEPPLDRKTLLAGLPEDIRQDLLQVSLMLSEGVLTETEATRIWRLIQERDPVVIRAFETCRQTDGWTELYDTLMRVLNDGGEGDSPNGMNGDAEPDASDSAAVFRTTIARLRAKDAISEKQAANLTAMFERKDEVVRAALEVYSIMHDAADLEETFRILATSQELLQNEREAKGQGSSQTAEDKITNNVVLPVEAPPRDVAPTETGKQKEKEWTERFAPIFD